MQENIKRCEIHTQNRTLFIHKKEWNAAICNNKDGPWGQDVKLNKLELRCGASLIAQSVKNSPAMQKTPIWFLGWEGPLEKGKSYPIQYSSLENSMDCRVTKSQTRLSDFHFHFWASLVAQLVKNLPAMRETWVWSLGWENSLEKGTATHSSILT